MNVHQTLGLPSQPLCLTGQPQRRTHDSPYFLKIFSIVFPFANSSTNFGSAFRLFGLPNGLKGKLIRPFGFAIRLFSLPNGLKSKPIRLFAFANV